jgi:tRNA(Ile)-lysidine synthase
VLLHLLHNHSNISAVHINHGLHKDADQWQQHCEQVCTDLGMPFTAIKVSIIKKPRHSLEALAREARYEALSSLMSDGSLLLTGHNQNDQAETVLLQLMRGAGVKGLSGMPVEKPFATGQLVRPLLSVSRSEIEAYARQHNLQWIEDPSNAGDDFDRNFLRNKIFPELETRRNGVLQNIARSASHMAQTAELTEALAAIDYQVVQGDTQESLNIEQLKTLSDNRQSNVIRYWLMLLGLRLPSQAVLQQIKQQLLYSYPGSNPCVRFADVELKRDKINKSQLVCVSLCNI